MIGAVGIGVQSMVTLSAKAPAVSLTMAGAEPLALSPAEARQIAGWLLEAASHAESDAFLCAWAVEKIGASDVAVAALVSDFRTWREQREGK